MVFFKDSSLVKFFLAEILHLPSWILALLDSQGSGALIKSKASKLSLAPSCFVNPSM